MKKLLLSLLFGLASLLNAQMDGNGHMNPTDLDEITVIGTAIVEETTMNSIYYLDEDGDGNGDYHLNFGPYWYNPDSSTATRPINGDEITITGGAHENFNMDEQTIIVYEINGEFWRDPFFADWNNLGRHSHQVGNHHGGMMGYGFGWEHDTLVTTEITGTALVDTTFFMNHYYLDINNDSEPDYFLNFGPYWYEPESGAVRPLDGETITILGGMLETSMSIPTVVVYEIDGLVWSDSSSIGSHFGGGWLYGNMTDSLQFHSPFDNKDHMTIKAGWNSQGGHHGGGMNNSDSLFCQILEIYPENIPNLQNMNVMAGYEIQMFNPDGSSEMKSGGMMGGHMEFDSDISYQMHYTDKQLEHYNVEESSIKAKYWDNKSSNWTDVTASIHPETNTITFESQIVSNYVILIYNKATLIREETTLPPDLFELEQNYPNPFNPTTVIQFSLNEDSEVALTIYNLLGEKIAELIDRKMSAGLYSISFDATDLPSGIYFYELNSGVSIKVKKMNLIK